MDRFANNIRHRIYDNVYLGDTYYSGWKAELDGKETPVLRADYLLKVVVVSPGRHRIRFFYRPNSFYFGLGLTLVSGAVILWLMRRKKGKSG